MNYRKPLLVAILFSFILITPTYASVAPTIEWEKVVETSRPTRIYGQDLTSDGGLILVGQRMYGDSKNGVLIKVDSGGNKVWEKTITTTENDYLTDVQQTSNGGYIAIGSQHSTENLYDTWIIRTDSTGTIEWEQTFGWTGQDYGTSVLEDSNGDFVWVGSREHSDRDKVSYGKISSTGEPVKQIFSLTPSIGYKVIESSDGGYVIVGTGVPEEIYGGQMMMLKLNATLSKEWTTYQGYAGDRYLLDVIEATNGDFVGVGYSDIDLETTPWIIRLDPAGEKIGLAHFDDYDDWAATCFVPLENGGFVVSGRAYGEEFTCFMAGVDSNLDLEWIHEFDDPEVELTGMILNRADSLLFTGTLEGDIDMPAILKTGPVGDPFAYITFTVEDEVSSPIVGASIVANMKTDVGISGSTGQTGLLICDDVTPGIYSVQVSAEGYETETVQVECDSGESTVVIVSLNSVSEPEPEPEVSSVILTLKAQDADGSPLRSVKVVSTSTPEGQITVEDNSDNSGEVQFELLPGEYEFKLSKSSFEPKTFECTLDSDEVVTVIMDEVEPEEDNPPENEPEEPTVSVEPTEEPETDDGADFTNVIAVKESSGNNMLLYGGTAAVALIGVAAYVLKIKGVF